MLIRLTNHNRVIREQDQRFVRDIYQLLVDIGLNPILQCPDKGYKHIRIEVDRKKADSWLAFLTVVAEIVDDNRIAKPRLKKEIAAIRRKKPHHVLAPLEISAVNPDYYYLDRIHPALGTSLMLWRKNKHTKQVRPAPPIHIVRGYGELFEKTRFSRFDDDTGWP